MKYYINKQQEIFAYNLDGSQDYLIDDKEPITIEEVQAINKAKEDTYKSTIEYKISEAKQYLEAADFKMTVDYFGAMTEQEQEEVIDKRAEAREFIIANQGVQA